MLRYLTNHNRFFNNFLVCVLLLLYLSNSIVPRRIVEGKKKHPPPLAGHPVSFPTQKFDECKERGFLNQVGCTLLYFTLLKEIRPVELSRDQNIQNPNRTKMPVFK